MRKPCSFIQNSFDRTYSTRQQISNVLVEDDQTSTGAARINTAQPSCSNNTGAKQHEDRAPPCLLGSRFPTSRRPLTVVLVVGDVSRSGRGDDDGQHDEAEHEQKDDQVERDQEAQEGEVGQDACAEHPY